MRLSSAWTGCCKATGAIIVCGLDAPQGLVTALQLDAAHANKTAIEAVNRYSMMLPFVMK